jgi:threonine dehydratase
MIAVRNTLGLSTKIVGVVSAAAPAYALSFRQRRAISHPVRTGLADGLACRTPVPEALEVITDNVDHIVEVTEPEIAAAMRAYYEDTHSVAEGAAAAALAALLQERDSLRSKRIGVVLTGGNVDREVFLKALQI